MNKVEVAAVIVAVTNSIVKVLTLKKGKILPYRPLIIKDISLQKSVHQWIYKQTNQNLGYIEQLYTFLDKKESENHQSYHVLVSYLGLVKENSEILPIDAQWTNWYHYFLWEDKRQEKFNWIYSHIIPIFLQWIENTDDKNMKLIKQQRMEISWGYKNYSWNEEYVLQRYELLYEVGLVPEAPNYNSQIAKNIFGQEMYYNHRRILASAITRIRAKIKYRPVIFELMPKAFTLLGLQECVESLSGIKLHKQNFRRLIYSQQLIEPVVGKIVVNRGRPAQLFRFRKNVLLEHTLMSGRLPQINIR